MCCGIRPDNRAAALETCGPERSFKSRAAKVGLAPILAIFSLAANARFRATDHLAAEIAALLRFRSRRAIGSALLLRLQQPSARSNWRGINSAAQADVSEEMLIGVAKVDIGAGAGCEERLQERQWKAQGACEGRRRCAGLQRCRKIGHVWYPSEKPAGMAGL